MAKFTFLDLAEQVLKASESPLAASEIWKIAVDKKINTKLDSTGVTPWASLGARLYVDSKETELSRFFRLSSNPVLFGLKQIHTATVPSPKKAASVVASTSFKERNLHPLLTFFARLYLDGVYAKTIFHEKSGKKSFNEWLHPDLVGVRFPDFDAIQTDAFELSETIGQSALEFFSFELKRNLSFSNLRESFFQAVSNSSWANFGYLASAEISVDTDFLRELKRLSGSFGIGVILLNLDKPDDSSVLYPAHKREQLDWESVNKLAKENPDFSRFLKDVLIDLRGKKIHSSEYDRYEQDSEQLKKLVLDTKS